MRRVSRPRRRAAIVALAMSVVSQVVLGAGVARAGHTISTTVLTYTATTGGTNPDAQTFTFSGPSTCDGGTVSPSEPWLSASPAALPDYTSASSTVITVSVDTTGLVADVYSGTVTVDPIDTNPSASEPCDGAKVVTVTLTVSDPTPPPNVAPAVAATEDPVSADEGDTAVNTGTWSDANAGDTVNLSASIGSVVQAGTNAAGTWSWSFGTSDGPDESQTVTITADDGAGGISSTSFGLTVDNVAPTTTLDAGNDLAVDEGDSVVYSFSVSDPGDDTWSSDADCGSDGQLVGTTGATSFECLFADGDALSTIGVSSTDSDDDEGNTATQGVTIDNVAPTTTLDSENLLTVNEDLSATVLYGFSVTDPGGDTWTSDPACGAAGTLGTATATSFECTFPDGDDSSIVSVSSTDSDGDEGNTASQTVNIENVAPTSTLDAGNDLDVDEGSTVVYGFAVDEPGDDTWTSSAGCGLAGLLGTTTASTFACTFADGDDTSTISVSSTDSDLETGNTDTQTVTVNNVAPTTTLDPANVLTVAEGGSLTFAFSVTDPGVDSWTSAFDCGGGTLPTSSTATSFTCLFPDGPASPTIGVSSTDSDGDTGNTATQSVTVANVAPTTTLDPANVLTVAEGGSLTFAFSVTDPGVDSWTSAFDCGGGTLPTSSTATSFTCAFPDGPASPVVGVSSTDSDLETGNTDTQTVTVSNVAPTTTLDPANVLTVAEGGSLTFAFSVTDPGVDTWTSAFDCGGGTLPTSSTATSFTCLFPDGPASPVVGVSSRDSDGDTGNTATQVVAVSNVAPIVTAAFAAFAAGAVSCGPNNGTLNVSFFDPGVDTHSASIDWGDGSPAQVLPAVTTPFSQGHTYAIAGLYNATVTVTDSDGDAGTDATNALTVNYDTGGILQPVNWTQAKNDPSIFKYGSTIPVKVQFFNCDGTSAGGGLSIKIAVKKIAGSTPASGENEALANTNSPDSGGYMRWADPHYMYNLNTKSLSDSTATYEITLTVESTGQTVTTLFGTKAK